MRIPDAKHCEGQELWRNRDVAQHQRAPEDAMADKTLNDLFFDNLKDIYFAERQILKNLPKLAKAARSDELKGAFLKHREETEGQIERLQQIFEMLGKRAQGKTCEAIIGILEEGEETIEAYKDSEALDAGLLAGGQAVEHYEMARYGALKNWAMQLGMKEAANLLDETLQEEKKTDALLTRLAATQVNRKAA
jgi:ferritin-like metal-binding protein YciE